jgi:hypothetical protein
MGLPIPPNSTKCGSEKNSAQAHSSSARKKHSSGRSFQPDVFSPFFAFLAKTRPKTPFGIPQAFQPSPKNIIIYLVIILFRIDSALSH